MWLPYAPNSSWLPYDCITSFRSHKRAHMETTSTDVAPPPTRIARSDWMSLSKRVSSFIHDWVVRTTVGSQLHGCGFGWSRSASSWVRLQFSLLYKQPREFPKFILGDFNWTMVNMSYHQSQQKYIHNPSPRQSRKRHNKRKRVSFRVVLVFLSARLWVGVTFGRRRSRFSELHFFSLLEKLSCFGSDPAAVFGQRSCSHFLFVGDF